MKYIDTIKEEVANCITHGLGVALGIVALVVLLVQSNTQEEYLSSIIFGVSVINLYLMSTLYHAFPKGATKRLFKRFDHLSIYILIAGSYTPFLIVLLNNDKGLILFTIQWILVILGIIFKTIWIERFQKLHLVIFLMMGWMAILFISDVITFSNGLFSLLLFGGVSYTVGAFFYATKLFKYHHSLWHLFVLAGTLLHFLGISLYLLQ